VINRRQGAIDPNGVDHEGFAWSSMIVEPRVGMFRRLCGHRYAPAKELYIEAGHDGESYETRDALEQQGSVERANVLFTPGKLSSVGEPAGARRRSRYLGALLPGLFSILDGPVHVPCGPVIDERRQVFRKGRPFHPTSPSTVQSVLGIIQGSAVSPAGTATPRVSHKHVERVTSVGGGNIVSIRTRAARPSRAR
jgi:hypothetical protein